MKINCTSRMSKGMELNGNTLTGDTFAAKEYIKTYWSGKWNAESKSWTVDGETVVKMIEAQQAGFCKVLNIGESAPVVHTTEKAHGVNGWCNKCHSYCYGDCTSR